MENTFKISLFSVLLTLFLGYVTLQTIQSDRYKEKQPSWCYHIHESNLMEDEKSTWMILIHENQEELKDLQLEIEYNSKPKEVGRISSLTLETIEQILYSKKKDINNIVIKSHRPIKFQSKVRLLEAVNYSSVFLSYSLTAFEIIIACSRNLLIIALITNSFDTCLPFIIFFQSLLMLSLWANQKHYLTAMFNNIFNSKFDLINFFRLLFSSSCSLAPIQQLNQYGFSNLILCNISGELLVMVAVFIFTIFVKAGNVFLKFQKLRSFNSKLRPFWNGFAFALTPRLATFAGFHCRMIATTSFPDIINGVMSSLIFGGLIFFFVVLIIQTRKINENIECIDESRLELGVARRINFEKDFEFDCLHFPMLYYPAMNYFRLLLFFIPIGASYDFYYVAFGGPILSQVLIIMIEVSSTGFTKKYQKFFFPLLNFMVLVTALCVITVGLAESVLHSEVSVIAEIIYFSALIIITLASLILLTIDTVLEIREMCKEEKKSENDKEDRNNFVKRKYDKTNKIQRVSTQAKEDESSDNSDEDKSDDSDIHDSMGSLQKTIVIPKLKIKKVRRGKII